MLADPVVHQGLIECCLERTPLSQVCPDAVFQTLIELLDASICLWIVVCRADVLYVSITEEPREVCREKLGPVICGDGMRHAPAYKQGLQDLCDKLC